MAGLKGGEIKYLILLIPILLFSGGDAVAQGMCQQSYIQCNQSNQMRFRADQRWCNSDAFNDTYLRQNCIDKAQWDFQRRTRQCEQRFQSCWWTYEEEDSFFPFPMR